MSIPEKLKYGAAELKRVYEKNLSMAFGISVGIHLCLFLIYSCGMKVGKAGGSKTAPVAKMKLMNLAPPPQQASTEPPPPPPMIQENLITNNGGGGVASYAGTPVAVPDALITPDMKEFATTKEVNVATTTSGDGTGFKIEDTEIKDNSGNGPKVQVDEKKADEDKLPEPDEFVSVEKDANLDYDDLQKRVEYPEIARRNNVEGKVIIRVLVGKDGRAMKTLIDQSDNKLLESAAKKAVLETSFTPAIQNGTPVVQWISVPVNFKLSQ